MYFKQLSDLYIRMLHLHTGMSVIVWIVAGDHDNRNLKDDGSSQALDYEEIERLKAQGLRDQVCLVCLVYCLIRVLQGSLEK